MPLSRKNFKVLIELLKKPKRTQEDYSKISELILLINELNPYIFSLSPHSMEQMVMSLKLVTYRDMDTIFTKGSPSDTLYIIAKGHIWLYDYNEYNHSILVTSLGQGKILGERGLIRSLPRSLTAISKKKTYLITLNCLRFRDIISTQLQVNIEEKLEFVDKIFPKAMGFKAYHKERIAYCFESKLYKRDEIVVEEGKNVEYLMAISVGECIVLKNDGSELRICCVGSGCIIAEECIFFDESSRFSYKVISDNAKLFCIKKEHFFNQCPSDLLNRLKEMCAVRLQNRNEMLKAALRISKSKVIRRNMSELKFPSATPVVRKKLEDYEKASKIIKLPLVNQPSRVSPSKVELLRLRRVKAFGACSTSLSMSFSFNSLNASSEHL